MKPSRKNWPICAIDDADFVNQTATSFVHAQPSDTQPPVGIAIDQLRRTLYELCGTVAYLRRDFRSCLRFLWDQFIPSSDRKAKTRIDAILGIAERLLGQEDISVSWRQADNSVLEIATQCEARIPDEKCKLEELAETFLNELQVNQYLPKEFFGEIDQDPSIRSLNIATHTASTARLLRRTSRCLTQFGKPKAAELCLEIAKRLPTSAMKRLGKSMDLSNFRQRLAYTKILEQERLANRRRHIDLMLIGHSLWRHFDRLELASPVNKDTTDLSNAIRLTHELEDVARESPAADRDDYFEYRTDALGIRGRCYALQGHFLEAHRLLDQAVAGLDPTKIHQRVPLARTHLYQAEACTMSSAYTVAEAFSDATAPAVQRSGAVDHAHAKLLRAGREIDIAERHLTGGRRDLTMWVYLYIGRAQVCVEQLLLSISRFSTPGLWPETWEYKTYSRDIEQYINVGLGSIRSALDVIPYRESVTFAVAQSEPQHYAERKTLALWLQLMLLTDAALYVARIKELSRLNSILLDEMDRAEMAKMLTRQQQIGKFLDLWTDWSQTHRFDQFSQAVGTKNLGFDSRKVFRQWRRVLENYVRGIKTRRHLLLKLNNVVIQHGGAFWDVRRPQQKSPRGARNNDSTAASDSNGISK